MKLFFGRFIKNSFICPIISFVKYDLVKREFVDKELGLFFVTENIRARRLTFRTKNDVIYVTVPFGTSVGELKDAIEKLRSKLKMARVNQARAFIDLNFKIEADLFKLDLAVGERKRFLSHTDAGHTHIICPPDADFNNAELQNWFHKVILEALRKNAKAVLPPRLSILAQTHGIVRELRNENIDVINYTSNTQLFIQRALSPAKISSIRLNEEERKAEVFLKPEEVSLAIGKGGLNIKLASMGSFAYSCDRLSSYIILC